MIMDVKDDIQLFESIGLSEQKAKETLKNKQVSNNLKLAIIEANKLYKLYKYILNYFFNISNIIKIFCLYLKLIKFKFKFLCLHFII
uniref:Glutaminyl-tRNA synthetase n=1 Tax=Apis cerana TaxID=7461 RepID=V9IAY6_APICE